MVSLYPRSGLWGRGKFWGKILILSKKNQEKCFVKKMEIVEIFRVAKAGITEEGRVQGEKTQSSAEKNEWEIQGCRWRVTVKCMHLCVRMCAHACVRLCVRMHSAHLSVCMQ